jgi:hypothetical protein
MFAQVFDDKNSTSLLTKGGHVEERDGVTRWKRPLVTARDRQAGWLARRKHGSFVLSCLVLRFMLDMLITRLVLKARFAWKKEGWIVDCSLHWKNIRSSFVAQYSTTNSMTYLSIDDSINCPLWNSTARRRGLRRAPEVRGKSLKKAVEESIFLLRTCSDWRRP